MSKRKEKPEKDMEPLKAMGQAFQDIFQKTAESVNEAAKDTSDRTATIQSGSQAGSQAISQAVKQASSEASFSATSRLTSKTTSWSTSLTSIQRSILEYLHKMPADRSHMKFANITVIADELNIPLGTVRNTLRNYISKGLFIERHQCWRGTIQGIEYRLNEDLVDALLEGRICLNLLINRASVHSGQPFSQPLVQPLGQPFSHPISQSTSTSSKDFIKHTTRTEKEGGYDLDAVLRTPEMRYWTMSPNNLTARQLMSWIEEFGVNVVDLVVYLDYCRYDMVENGRESKIETKKDRKSVV